MSRRPDSREQRFLLRAIEEGLDLSEHNAAAIETLRIALDTDLQK